MSRLLDQAEAGEFKAMLDVYQLNESVVEQFSQSNFGVIAGPAGAGKDTLRDELLQRYPENYLPILSTTTRPPRPGEVDGVSYHFSEIETVRDALLNRQFFQAELVHGQQISGLNIGEVKKLSPNQWGLSILITAAERKLRVIKDNIRTVFLIPPSFEELMNRIESERILESDEVDRRLAAAQTEIGDALKSESYEFIVSDSVENVATLGHNYFQHGIRGDNTAARQVMEHILKQIDARKT